MRLMAIVCAATLCGNAAAALDVPIPAKISLVKPAQLAKFVSKSSSGFALPAPQSAEDPTVGGAELHLFDTESPGAGSATFVLGAAGWTGLGNPPGSKGYKYKGKNDTPVGPCSTVLLKGSVIKAVCKGAAVTLTPPFAATEGIILGLPAGTAASRRYCAELEGDEKHNDSSSMKRTDAPPPAVCPAPPGPPEPPTVEIDMNDLLELTDDALQGRNNNTAGSITAQQMLIRELNEMGASGLNGSETGDDAFKQPFVQDGSTGVNILGVIPGSELPNEYVMIGAHYDHVGGCRDLEPGDTVCNGATDNAAGVVAALAIGRAIAALPTAPRRSVVLAFWDAEEDGLLGSEYYVNNPLVPLASTVTYINYDIQGANLLPSVRNFTFAVGSETGTNLPTFVEQAATDSGITLDMRLLSYTFGQFRSDYFNFGSANVPTVFYSDSTGPCYHTDQDEVSVVDVPKLNQQTRNGYELTRALADTTTPPAFASPNFVIYADAVIIDEVVTTGLADLMLFSPADQMTLNDIQATIHGLVLDGEANFTGGDPGTVALRTIDVVDLLTRTACSGFL
jgi:hypothetical protein